MRTEKSSKKEGKTFSLPLSDNDLKVGVVKHHVVAQSIGAPIRKR